MSGIITMCSGTICHLIQQLPVHPHMPLRVHAVDLVDVHSGEVVVHDRRFFVIIIFSGMCTS